MWINRFHSHKFKINALIKAETKINTIAEQKGVFVNRKNFKLIRIPNTFRTLYLKAKITYKKYFKKSKAEVLRNQLSLLLIIHNISSLYQYHSIFYILIFSFA